MENKLWVACTNAFLTVEKNLYFVIILIGLISILIGGYFWLVSNNFKAFGVTFIVLGFFEMGFLGFNYYTYETKKAEKMESFSLNPSQFVATEKANIQKAVQSYVWIKTSYGLLILLFVLVISYSEHPTIKGILMALILHLGFAITIDNFAEDFTKSYYQKLLQLEAKKDR